MSSKNKHGIKTLHVAVPEVWYRFVKKVSDFENIPISAFWRYGIRESLVALIRNYPELAEEVGLKLEVDKDDEVERA